MSARSRSPLTCFGVVKGLVFSMRFPRQEVVNICELSSVTLVVIFQPDVHASDMCRAFLLKSGDCRFASVTVYERLMHAHLDATRDVEPPRPPGGFHGPKENMDTNRDLFSGAAMDPLKMGMPLTK
jgi:hypothetical protein